MKILKIFSNYAENLLNMLHEIASKDPPAFKISQFPLPPGGWSVNNFQSPNVKYLPTPVSLCTYFSEP